jgi:hypothetical protein
LISRSIFEISTQEILQRDAQNISRGLNIPYATHQPKCYTFILSGADMEVLLLALWQSQRQDADLSGQFKRAGQFEAAMEAQEMAERSSALANKITLALTSVEANPERLKSYVE